MIIKHIAAKPGSRVEFTTPEALANFLQANPDYTNGGSIEEDIPEPEELRQPREMAAWRVKHVLKLGGYIPTIEALIDSLPDPPKALIRAAWDNATIIDRWSPTVTFLQGHLQWSDEQVDAIFNEAENLPI